MTPPTYLKATKSEVSVDKSVAQIKKLVMQFGASGFSTSEDYQKGISTITFVLNTAVGQHVPVRIPVDVNRVYKALYADKPLPWSRNADTMKRNRMEQASRTAWRNVNLLVEAALSSVSLGVQTIEDVFLAHTLVVSDDGGTTRMADYLAATGGALAPGVRALLGPPREDNG